jgi:hypothetical protein
LQLREYLTIEIPEDLAASLRDLASAQNKSVEQIAVERLRSTVEIPGSRDAILRAAVKPPHVSPDAVNELERAIAMADSQFAERCVRELIRR